MTNKIRTRFAPSPTGFLHIGGARTALFSWAYAKKLGGDFILRVEDTDLERSTPESVTSILQAMDWLGLDYNEGPYFQTKRMARYQEVIARMLQEGTAYYCRCSKEELEQMREEQRARGEKPRYDRRCLHAQESKSAHDQLSSSDSYTRSSGTLAVVRFKNPTSGSVVWDDLVKGRIEIANSELDDLIIARSDGTPTYNFCVVVDDSDMQISQVIRGDDHINNTPRQINILRALGAPVPQYAHVPMILRDDGQKMSKRNDPVSVMDYRGLGILPEALLNYLARLCWGHGDAEVFTMEEFISWFDLDNISPSAARFDLKKLYWVNAQHIKSSALSRLQALLEPVLRAQGIDHTALDLAAIITLLQARNDNLVSLAAECAYFYQAQPIAVEDEIKYLTTESVLVISAFAHRLSGLELWSLDGIKGLIKEFCVEQKIKMPQLGMPLRLKLCGTTHTPAFDAMLYILGKNNVLARLAA